MANGSTSLGLVLVLALAAGAAGGAGAAFLLRDDRPAQRADRGYDDTELWAAVRRLEERERPAPAPRTVPAEKPSEIEIARPGDEPEPAVEEEPEVFEPPAYVESLRGKRFTVRDGDALVTRLSMDKDSIEPTIAALKKAIGADPSNPDLYAALAAAHVSKLAAGVAAGPAAGPVYMEAIAAYDKALTLNPDHWDARYGKAFTTSMAPEFVGLRPASIRMFEDLVQRQDALPKKDEFRRTYMRLGTLYKDAGNPEKAREVWKKGLGRFPDDRQMKAALEVLEKE